MMMSLMSKLLMSTIAATVTLSANAQPDEKVLLKYLKRNIVKNPQVTLKSVTVLESKTDDRLPGWTILLTSMQLEYQKQEMNAPEMMFIKDGIITGSLVDMKTGNDYSKEIKPSVPNSYYDDAHLVFGNKDAKHKVLIFSDPQCPFCQDVVPEIFKTAQKNPATLAIYYYHLPLLRIHPVSDVLTRVMHVAQHEGKMDILEKIYTLKIDPKETDTAKILAAVKAHAGYSVTEAQINAKSVLEGMKKDVDDAKKMMVSGTPTIYIDGKWDKMRDGYKALIK